MKVASTKAYVEASKEIVEASLEATSTQASTTYFKSLTTSMSASTKFSTKYSTNDFTKASTKASMLLPRKLALYFHGNFRVCLASSAAFLTASTETLSHGGFRGCSYHFEE